MGCVDKKSMDHLKYQSILNFTLGKYLVGGSFLGRIGFSTMYPVAYYIRKDVATI